MRVAVTGARGFIGRHLTAHLRRAGHDVLPLGRGPGGRGLVPVDRPESGDPDGLEEVLTGVEAVAHLAGRRVDSLATPLSEYLDANVVLTETTLQAAAAAGVQKFVLASTRLVYPSWLQGPAREDCPHPPDTFYGLSKRIAEDLVRIYAAREGLGGVGLRIGQVFGPGDEGRGVLPRFIGDARAGRPATVAGSGAAVRDFVDVRDVVGALERALSAPTTAPVINVGGPRAYSIRELAETVVRVAGMPASAVRFVEVDDEDTSHYSLDRRLAREQLGWEPELTLERSVADRLRDEQ